MEQKLPFITVIGASAGGIKAVTDLVAQIPDNLNTAVFVVIHLSKISVSNFLIDRLQNATNFSCHIAKHQQPISAGNVYLAPADRHMLVKNNEIILAMGPPENRWRPAIDVLFRSAAAEYSDRVIGIILTGMLNDGTAGMMAIKNSGGYCIVQDPNEAEYPEMPLEVVANVQVDACVHLSDIGTNIESIVNSAVVTGTPAPAEIKAEARLSEKAVIGIEAVSKIGTQSLFSCPDCGGGLWEVDDKNLTRYRCHIGHAYSQDELAVTQNEILEKTLWIALRMMEEKRALLNKISRQEEKQGLKRLAQDHQTRADDLASHIQNLKDFLYNSVDFV